MPGYVSVVPLARLSRAGKPYTYAIPEGMVQDLRPGQLVAVPFQNRTVAGIVFEVPSEAPVRARVKDLAGVTDPDPVLTEHQLCLARWISDEYRAPLSDVLSAMLPPILKKTERGRPSRREDGLLLLTAEGRVTVDSSSKSRSAGKRALLDMLQGAPGPVSEVNALHVAGVKRTDINALIARGWIERIEFQSKHAETSMRPHLSMAQSQAVRSIVATLRVAPTTHASNGHVGTKTADELAPTDQRDGTVPVFLLHGVTGSGKTEVYMSVIEEALNRGAGAIVMVPEISLTPQAQHRFTDRFPGLVATIHSELSPGPRQVEWERLRSGEAMIAVGPRSALFAPLSKIGVIIVDEEHDPSYKQGESPRYHAREAAIKLGELVGAPVILGSATPDVCSYYRARKGRYTLLSLPERPVWDAVCPSEDQAAGDGGSGTTATIQTHVVDAKFEQRQASRAMPSIEIVDLRQELKAGNRAIFSRALLAGLKETVANGRQALLFLNRRGNATSVVCRACGYVALCKACDIPLTYHSANTKLICHRCDRRFPSPSKCPACGSDHIRYLGVGTQRVAEEVSRAVPDARVLRWDRDVTGRKGAHEEIASTFENHEADVLVGTQLITKGLDFPLVTLVGVVVADIGMNFPDFRSAERTFQLMTQVSGRAGRAELPSQVIIQSYNPEHYALHAAKDHDYWSFYRQEMTFRHQAGYPPYNRLVRFLFKGKDDTAVARQAYALRDQLLARTDLDDSLQLIGPAPSFVARVDRVYQWHMLALGPDVHRLLDNVPEDVIVDVDPVDVL